MISIKLHIDGMTCNACQTKVEKALYEIEGVREVAVDLATGQTVIKADQAPELEVINDKLKNAGNYRAAFGSDATKTPVKESVERNQSYRPLLILVVYLVGITGLIELASGMFLWDTWMPNFMAGFFLAFSFFKMLDIRGFANAYRSYDLIAARIPSYGLLFPFIELGLGVSYILFPDNPLTHLITAIIMFISLLGVVLAVTNKKKIQCACLGTVV